MSRIDDETGCKRGQDDGTTYSNKAAKALETGKADGAVLSRCPLIVIWLHANATLRTSAVIGSLIHSLRIHASRGELNRPSMYI
jgi:hypothetical protein